MPEYTFAPGDIVEIDPVQVQHYPAKYSGRRAIVGHCFVPLGSKTERVNLRWIHKRTGKPIGHQEYFYASVLRKSPPTTQGEGE